MNKYTETKTKLFDTECGKIEIVVGYIETIEQVPLQVEECHGTHLINNDTSEIILTSVEIVVPNGMAIDILPSLTYHQKRHFIEQID